MSESELSIEAGFDRWVQSDGERLRRVLVARYGLQVGNDVCSDAFAYAWEHWARLAEMENAVGYLYRVAQSASRRHRRWSRSIALPAERPQPDSTRLTDSGLATALARLSDAQRVCVVLVHVYDWSYRDTADAVGEPESAVRNHLHRGLKKLRTFLEEAS